jgi:hypothetical protein
VVSRVAPAGWWSTPYRVPSVTSVRVRPAGIRCRRTVAVASPALNVSSAGPPRAGSIDHTGPIGSTPA